MDIGSLKSVGNSISELGNLAKQAGGKLLLGPFNSFLGKGLNLDKVAGGLFDSLTSPNTWDALINNWSQAHMTGAQKEQNEWTAMREDSYWQRNVEGMQEAGLNPALLYGGSASGATPSASAAPASGMSLSDLLELSAIKPQIDLVNAQAENARADAALKRTNADLNEQLRIFYDQIHPLQVEAQKVSNHIGRSTVNKINAECDKIAEEMRKIAAETETEATKQLYNFAAASLADAQADQIVQMLPYSIELAQAQTQQAKAIARLNFVQAAYQKKLLSEGFVDSLISQQESIAEMQEVKRRIKTGQAFTVDDTTFLGKAWNFFAEASGLSHGVQVIDYLLDKINVFAPMISKSPTASSTLSTSHDPFGYVAD